jgi:hypothetical protein
MQDIAEAVVNDVFAKCHADEMPFSADRKTTGFSK